jgi:DNA-binding response OmpR family regulator
MPRTSGIELARAIRARSPEIPILFATGYADLKTFGKDIEKETTIRKPYHMAEVAERIEAVLDP